MYKRHRFGMMHALDMVMVYTYNELMKQWDECLDSIGNVKVAGLTYSQSTILKAVDPVAYRNGFKDYLDSLGIYENEREEYTDEEE